jgi:hypothetical protein
MAFTEEEENVIHERLFGSGLTDADMLKLHSVVSSAAELNKLVDAGDVVASGTTQAHIAAVTAETSAADLATCVNAILVTLEAFKLAETS